MTPAEAQAALFTKSFGTQEQRKKAIAKVASPGIDYGSEQSFETGDNYGTGQSVEKASKLPIIVGIGAGVALLLILIMRARKK